MKIHNLVIVVIILSASAATATDWFQRTAWVAAVTYRQDENAVYIDTTGNLPPQVQVLTAATANAIKLELPNLRVNPAVYTLAPHDGVIDIIRLEGFKRRNYEAVTVTIETSKPFPYETERRQVDGVSQIIIRLTDVDVKRLAPDAAGKAPLYARAAPDGQIVAFLPFHTKVRVLDYGKGMYLVRAEDNALGWVAEKNLKIEGDNPFKKAAPAVVLDDAGARVVATAKKYLGAPYVWGGTGPEGFDCSGLVQTVFAENGIALPRGAGDQYREGKKISKNALRPGDLVFFHTYTAGPSHVGIYVGGGKFLHAESSPAGVTVTPLDAPYWRDRWLGARRWVNQ